MFKNYSQWLLHNILSYTNTQLQMKAEHFGSLVSSMFTCLCLAVKLEAVPTASRCTGDEFRASPLLV